jgi:hypothetical protein
MADLLAALCHDWTHLRDTTAPLPRTWCEHEPALAAHADLTALEARVHDRQTPTETVDAVFAALLRTHPRDARAGRVVVGLLLPSLARHRRGGPDGDEHLAQLVAELWHGICHYPIHRRPRAIAANLTLDARRRATRTTTTANWQPLTDPDLGTDRDTTSGRVHDRLDLAEMARGADIADQDLLLIAATRVGGWRIADLATDRGDADRLRQRRRRAEARLHRTLAA